MVQVDEAMVHYRDKIRQTFHVDMDEQDGSGAAGGIGGLLLAVFGARMVPGIELIMEYSGLEDAIAKADMVITGEGQTDRQTLSEKSPMAWHPWPKNTAFPASASPVPWERDMKACMTPAASGCFPPRTEPWTSPRPCGQESRNWKIWPSGS